MFKEGQRVKCKITGLEGFVDSKEWENGWTYTIITDNHVFFYRNEEDLVSA